jgi:deazaflavin-dependent oxidoreductase (nitroreductase family)
MASARHRFLKAMGESGFWRVAGRIHTYMYRKSGGRLGATGGGLNHLLLTTTGRKSGKARTCPLTYLKDGDDYVLVASNGGSDRPPAWFFNLTADPSVRLEVEGRTIDARARTASEEDRPRLWTALKEYNPFYGDYEQITDRQIPVVVCSTTTERNP